MNRIVSSQQAIAKMKALIAENKSVFDDWFGEQAKFPASFTAEKKVEYFRANETEILRNFCKVIKKMSEDYDTFFMDFAEWIENQNFPIETKVQVRPEMRVYSQTASIPAQRNPPTALHIATNNSPYQNQSNQTVSAANSQLRKPRINPIYYQRKNHEQVTSEAEKRKKLLIKLAECFDQPEKRFRNFAELKIEVDELQ